jgi:hypothetical protein
VPPLEVKGHKVAAGHGTLLKMPSRSTSYCKTSHLVAIQTCALCFALPWKYQVEQGAFLKDTEDENEPS